MMIMFPSIYVPHSPFSPSLPSLRMKFILIILNNAKNNTSFRFNLPHRFLLIRTVLSQRSLSRTHMFSSPSSFPAQHLKTEDCSLVGERCVLKQQPLCIFWPFIMLWNIEYFIEEFNLNDHDRRKPLNLKIFNFDFFFEKFA